MKHLAALSLCSIIAFTFGCNSGTAQDDGIEPLPSVCYYGNHMFEDGEEFQGHEGCVSFRCEEGTVVTLEDNRETVQGDLELSTQAEVDEHSCLGVVEGSLTITGEVRDVTLLSPLYEVGGDLEIAASELTSTRGLGELGEIGGHLRIADNAQLVELHFQPNMALFGDLTIQNNDALTSLHGVEFVSQCISCTPPTPPMGANTDDGGVPAPPDEEPFGGDEGPSEPVLGAAYGAVTIADNDVLVDITALRNLGFAWSDFVLRNNAVLTSLGNLALSEVQGNLEISLHPQLPTADVDLFVGGIDVWGQTTICGNNEGIDCPAE